MEWDSNVGEKSQQKMIKKKFHMTLMNKIILKESNSYLDFQQIFQHIQNYQLS